MNQNSSVRKLVHCGVVAAIYVVLCLALQPLSYGAVQVRVAEALCLLPVFGTEYILGVVLGCFLANLLGSTIVDVIFGTLATLLACLVTYRLRNIRFKGLALAASLPPVLFNAVIIGIEIAVMFPDPSSSAPIWLACITNGISVGIGELISCTVLGGLLAILLFTVLPTLIVGGVNHFVTLGRWAKVVLEAVLKVGIFLTYMVGISKMKEIHRVFEYHGAEHKTIACYEAGDPLTVENVRKYTRFHPRCGTSFLILVVIVSVFLYSVLPWGSIGLRVLFKLLLLPLVMGISYELLKWCGRSDNFATRIIRQPGIWVQHLTVFEPEDSMIEVAIAAVTPVLPENPEEGKW